MRRTSASTMRLKRSVSATGSSVGKVVERRVDRAAITATRQPLEEIGQNQRVGHARNARRGGVGGRRDAEQLHHLRALLAEALVRRIPDHVAILERLDERAHVVARNGAFGLHRAARMQEFAYQRVLGRAVHDVERHARRERAAADLDGIEMRGQQQHAAARSPARPSGARARS